MAWHGKPSGGYATNSTEGIANIWEMHYIFQSNGYALEAQCGAIGNVINESALNVWRWQNDTVSVYSGGYGLFQYTASDPPAYSDRYIDVCSSLPYYAPNMSTSTITSGAQVTDAICQMNVFMTDYLHKWNPYIWRSYWPTDATLRAKVNHILSTYGNGTTLSMAQFKTINNIEDATIAFLGAFEGPAVPNYSVRVQSANQVYTILQGTPPFPPGPTPLPRTKIPVWMMCKPIYRK